MTVQRDRHCACPHRECVAAYYVGLHTHSHPVCSATVQHSPAQSETALGHERHERRGAPAVAGLGRSDHPVPTHQEGRA